MSSGVLVLSVGTPSLEAPPFNGISEKGSFPLIIIFFFFVRYSTTSCRAAHKWTNQLLNWFIMLASEKVSGFYILSVPQVP